MADKAWLLTWNESNWAWDDYEEACNETRNGNELEVEWTCSSTYPEIGDDVFLIKLGQPQENRGIIAWGKVTQGSFKAPHYDLEQAKNGKTNRKIKVAFERILDYHKEQFLSYEELKKLNRSCNCNQNWSPQGSGIRIDDKLLYQLKNKLNKITGNRIIDQKIKAPFMRNQDCFDKNIILFGPPGTGKTYITSIYAVAICEGKSLDEVKADAQKDYGAVRDRYNKLIQDGRVDFTTFHQSYGYEEFIEGIKPNVDDDVYYKIEPGVFKRFCEKAAVKKLVTDESSGLPIKENPVVWKVSLEGSGDNSTKRDCFDNNRIRIGWPDLGETINTDSSVFKSSKEKQIITDFIESMEEGDLVVVLKDKNSIDAIGVIDGPYEWLKDHAFASYPRSRKVKWLAKNINEDIRSVNNGKTLTLSTVYRLKVDPNEIIKLAKKNNSLSIRVEEETKPYVFIIDEINRGNISKIFGELITLIEDTKREGTSESAFATLPYSGDKFSVPSNVYIIGTMNTADRSIALIDTALRRRFNFIEMMPDESILDGIEVDGLNVDRMLRKINERITFLYDREHTIGHAFFIKLKSNPDIDTLQSIFEKSVIPLLQEYFYEDYQKIQLVLGDNAKDDPKTKFIIDEKIKVKEIFNRDVADIVDLPEKKFTINKEAFSNIDSYKRIIK